MVTLEQIKALREETGVSVMQCKKALEEAGGDREKARALLRRRGAEVAAKKQGRTLAAGVIASYVHADDRIGVLVEVLSETDFVARNDDFKTLADDIALHIAAMNPQYVKDEDISPDERAELARAFADEPALSEKPEAIRQKIVDGKTDAHFKERTLLRQQFVKEPEITVQELIERAVHKLGEKIEVTRFVRYTLLEE